MPGVRGPLASELDESFYDDFSNLLTLTQRELLTELVDTAVSLARLSERIGYLRSVELTDSTPMSKSERLNYEGVRAVYEEKKWVLIRLLDIARA